MPPKGQRGRGGAANRTRSGTTSAKKPVTTHKSTAPEVVSKSHKAPAEQGQPAKAPDTQNTEPSYAPTTSKYNLRRRNQDPSVATPISKDPRRKAAVRKTYEAGNEQAVSTIRRQDPQDPLPAPLIQALKDRIEAVLGSENLESSAASTDSEFNEVAITQAWYRAHGFVPPHAEDILRMIRASPLSTTTSKTSKADQNPKEDKKQQWMRKLEDRRVQTEESEDEQRKEFHDLILDVSPTTLDADEEEKWKADMQRCKISDEAVYQRTIMMDILDRHKLTESLDYNCEAQWTCLPVPSGIKWGWQLPSPRPDLFVAFKARAILNMRDWPDLQNLRDYMCPETAKQGYTNRAFPFFAMEVKGAQADLGNVAASYQNLNTASQALYNIYLFMAMANDLEIFHRDVRFFSVISTSSTFQLRMHRAREIPVAERRESGSPLDFEFDTLFQRSGDYSKQEVTTVVKNIFEYGVNVLLPILRSAVDRTLKRLKAEPVDPLAGSRQTTPRPRKKRTSDETNSVASRSSTQRRLVKDLRIEDSPEMQPLS